MVFGLSTATLRPVFSSFFQPANLKWTRHYSQAYLKDIYHLSTKLDVLPRLDAETFSTIKNLGISRFRRGCRGGIKAKYRQNSNKNLHIPVRINSRETFKQHGFVNFSNLININTAKFNPSSYCPKALFSL